MASYGTIYEFRFDDINGDDVDIFIAKKNYTGSVTRRALGRTPILKRERSGNILGTSLEIYAECRVDGEFAQLYTSSADEFRVEVYKRQNLLWRGFVSPELYSEPDIAPPYDVQIIATDGLGELKSYDFVQGERPRSFLGHLNAMLMYTGLDFSVEAVSGLQYYDDGWIGNTDMMSVVIDMSHKDQEDCYAVLQSMLASVNACITQQDCKWMVIRESDLYNLTDRLSPIPFGSMNECDWWPIGNLSADIIPAKKSLTLVSKNQYKSVLGNSDMTVDAVWAKEYDAHYDIEEGCYRLPEQYSAIVQNVNFHAEVGYRLVLNVSARNIGEGESSQMLGVMVRIDGRMYQAGSSFWLHQLKDHENKYGWSTIEGYIEIELPEPSKSDTRSDAKSIDIILPLYKYDNRSYAYATSVEVTLLNVSGNMPIGVYRCALSQYDQYPGTQIEAIISNDAREDVGEIELAFGDGEYAQPAADVFRSAIPLSYDSEVIIKRWRTPAAGEGSYLSVFARDYAMQVALPRMRYRGKLNVPSLAYPRIPVLFERDNTYYFLNTYSFDLLNSELEVELISVPNARVEIESETVTELPSSGSGSAPSSGGSTGGGGTSGGGGSDIVVDASMSDTSTNPVQNKVVKKYVDDAETRAKKYTDEKISQIETGGGSITVDTEMSDSSENAVQNKVIKAYVDKHPQYEVIEDIEVPDLPEGPQGSVDLTGYATEQWVENKGYATRSWVNGRNFATEQWVGNQGFVDKTYVGSQINAYSANTYALIAALEERITALEKMLEGVDGASGCYFIPTGVTFADDIVSVSYDKVGVMVEPLTVKTIAKITGSIPCAKESTVSSSLANLVTMFNENDLSIVYVPGNQYTIEITVVTSDSNGTTTKKESFTFTA